MILRVLFLALGLLLLAAHRPEPEPKVCVKLGPRLVVGTPPWPVAYVQTCRTWRES